MSDSNGHGVGLAVATFVAGAAIGGAVALLFAPRSGEETRELLRAKKDEFAELLERKKQLVEQLLGTTEEKVREGVRKELGKLEAALASL